MDGTLEVADGQAIGYATFGRSGGVPVVWCHGGPGSRLEPALLDDAAEAAGLTLIGIDRPGYGLSTPNPGRTIAGWVPDALAVADHLLLDRFYTVAVSTGGAYALALAALAPARVLGVVACCAMTDMRDGPARSKMGAGICHALWDAPDRAAATAAAVAMFGEDGRQLLQSEIAQGFGPSDLALFEDPTYLAASATGFPAMFAWGVQGYTDDRLADGPGWKTFDVAEVVCPVTVLHGDADGVVDVIHARHTVSILPNARLALHPALGHLSIMAAIVPTLEEMLRR